MPFLPYLVLLLYHSTFLKRAWPSLHSKGAVHLRKQSTSTSLVLCCVVGHRALAPDSPCSIADPWFRSRANILSGLNLALSLLRFSQNSIECGRGQPLIQSLPQRLSPLFILVQHAASFLYLDSWNSHVLKVPQLLLSQSNPLHPAQQSITDGHHWFPPKSQFHLFSVLQGKKQECTAFYPSASNVHLFKSR